MLAINTVIMYTRGFEEILDKWYDESMKCEYVDGLGVLGVGLDFVSCGSSRYASLELRVLLHFTLIIYGDLGKMVRCIFYHDGATTLSSRQGLIGCQSDLAIYYGASAYNNT